MKKNILLFSIPALFLLTFFALAFSLLGCGRATLQLKCYNPATDAFVTQFFTQKVSISTSTPFTVTITETAPLNVPTATGIGGPRNYKNVPGGQKFTVEITVKDPNGAYTFYEYFEDEYTLNGTTHPASSTHYFMNRLNTHSLMNTFGTILTKVGITDYKIVEDPADPDNNFDVFLCSNDYDALNEALKSFKTESDTRLKYSTGFQQNQNYTAYGVYIFKDKSSFESIDITSFTSHTPSFTGLSWGGDVIELVSGKSASRIDSADNFDEIMFTTNGGAHTGNVQESPEPLSFDYVVFWAYSEPNAQNICNVQLFGVK